MVAPFGLEGTSTNDEVVMGEVQENHVVLGYGRERGLTTDWSTH